MNETLDIDRIRERLAAYSKALIGASPRAAVAAYICVGSGPFWARSMSEALAIPEGKVSLELTRFTQQGLLAAMQGADSWDRRRLLVKPDGSDTSFWEMGLGLVRRAALDVARDQDVDASELFRAYLEHVHRDDPAALERTG